MKKTAFVLMTGLFLAFCFAGSVSAQEEVKKEATAEIAISVVKDGKTVLDTTLSSDGDVDKEMIDKLVRKYAGDEVSVKVVSKINKMDDDEDSFVWVTTDGQDEKKVIKIMSSDGNKVIKEGNVMVVTKEGDDEEFTFEVILEEEVEGKDIEKIIKKHNNGEDVEVKVIKGGNMMIIDHDGEELHEILKKHGNHEVKVIKKGDAVFFGDDHKNHHVKILKKDDDMVWINDEEGELFFDSEELKSGGQDFFFKTESQKKQAISLKPLENGDYRLEVNTDELEPIVVEVFNSVGDRLYKKKVRNYYGRYLQEVNLSGNESAFFTVKVTQGEKEIIGEFEFK